MKEYKIGEKRSNGTTYSRVSLKKKGMNFPDILWSPLDKKAEAEALKKADMIVINHGLKYKTRKLKPVK